MSEYEIVQYLPEYKYDVARIEQHLWGTDIELNVKYLEWKYEQNPYRLMPSLYLSMYEGKVVGATGFSWGIWQVGKSSSRLVVPGNADASIDPEHRRRGLLSRMNVRALEDFAKANLEYTYTFSANPSSAAAILKLGFSSVGNIEIGYRLHASERTIESSSLIARGAQKIANRFRARSRALGLSDELEANPLNLVDKRISQHGGRYSEHISVGMSPKPDEMAELIEHIGYDGRLRQVRDQQFFNWRYKNPFSRYRFLFYKVGSNLKGYIIIRASAFPLDQDIRIVDLEAIDDTSRAELLKAAVDLCTYNTLVIWTDSLSGEGKSILINLGFAITTGGKSLETNHPNIFIYDFCQELSDNPFHYCGIDLMDRKNWDLRAIYSDAY
jgi:RimJ/RimL family protein N-acetyltransferase